MRSIVCLKFPRQTGVDILSIQMISDIQYPFRLTMWYSTTFRQYLSITHLVSPYWIALDEKIDFTMSPWRDSNSLHLPYSTVVLPESIETLYCWVFSSSDMLKRTVSNRVLTFNICVWIPSLFQFDASSSGTVSSTRGEDSLIMLSITFPHKYTVIGSAHTACTSASDIDYVVGHGSSIITPPSEYRNVSSSSA